jgi:hypothetical protein
VQAEVQSKSETVTRQWHLSFLAKDAPFGANCYHDLEQWLLFGVRSPRFEVVEVTISDLPPIVRPVKPQPPKTTADRIAELVNLREQMGITDELHDEFSRIQREFLDPNRASRDESDGEKLA